MVPHSLLPTSASPRRYGISVMSTWRRTTSGFSVNPRPFHSSGLKTMVFRICLLGRWHQQEATVEVPREGRGGSLRPWVCLALSFLEFRTSPLSVSTTQLQADGQNCNEKQLDIHTTSVLTKGLKRHARLWCGQPFTTNLIEKSG